MFTVARSQLNWESPAGVFHITDDGNGKVYTRHGKGLWDYT